MSDTEILRSVTEALAAGREALLGVSGCSMLPALRPGGDVVLLRPMTGSAPRLYDIVLACLPDGRTVLHRVVASAPDGTLTLMGDGNLHMRELCPAGCVCGRVAEVLRPDGCGGLSPRIPSRRFGRLWTLLLRVRPLLLRIYRLKHKTKTYNLR